MAKKVIHGGVSSPVGYKRTIREYSNGRLSTTSIKVGAHRKTGEIFRSEKTTSFNLFGFILLLLLAVTLISFLSGRNETISFAGFLEFLQTMPNASFIEQLPNVSLSLPDWLDWLEVVLNFFVSLINLGTFLINGMWQALVFIWHFLKWVF